MLRDLHLLTAKPVMYVANVSEDGFTDNPHLDAVREARASSEGALVVPVCAAIEAEIAQLEEADRAEFLHELKLDEPGLNRVIRGGYQLLGSADLLHRGSEGSARLDGARGCDRAAGRRRHSHGLRARLHPRRGHRVRRLRRQRRRSGAREAGKMRLEGKEYVVREGDVMHFRFNV